MKKCFAIVLSMIILITTFFATEYSAQNCMHTNRTCTTSSCPVCASLNMAKQITSRIHTFISLLLLSFFAFIFSEKIKEYDNTSLKAYSLVKQKIRLNN